jgi:hypothetical protein|nr:MAG TPA: hypothetical protein [Caudoviricetes sp.]
MEKLKIGDKVQILPTLSDDSISGGIGVVPEMVRYAGKIATINRVISTKGLDGWVYNLDIDNRRWNWTSRMFVSNSTIHSKRERNRSITF